MNSPGSATRSPSMCANVWPGRLLHREHLDRLLPDDQPVAVALDGGVRDEVVQVRVVGQRRRRRSSPGRSSPVGGRTGRPRTCPERRSPQSASWTSTALALWCSVPMARSSSLSSSAQVRSVDSQCRRASPRSAPGAAQAMCWCERRSAVRTAGRGSDRRDTVRAGARSGSRCAA